jgi:hypothetical protein
MYGRGGYDQSGEISIRRVAYDSEDNWLPAVYKEGERILKEKKKIEARYHKMPLIISSAFFRFHFVTISASSLSPVSHFTNFD